MKKIKTFVVSLMAAGLLMAGCSKNASQKITVEIWHTYNGSQQEYLVNVCYSRAYKIMKSKVENAQELLQSAKKVLSHRMQEMELTKLQ